jgi:hypothetical protein
MAKAVVRLVRNGFGQTKTILTEIHDRGRRQREATGKVTRAVNEKKKPAESSDYATVEVSHRAANRSSLDGVMINRWFAFITACTS